MVADASPWVVALSSDSEDEDRPPNRRTADNGVAEQNFSIDEDEDMQVLNVTKPGEQLEDDNFVRHAIENQLPSLLSNAGDREILQFTAIKDPLTQFDPVDSKRQKRKQESREKRRIRAALRLQESGGNDAEAMLTPREVPGRIGKRAQVGGVPSAATGLGFIDMERLVTGTNTRDWCSSLRMCHGSELSNLHWNIVKFCETHKLTAEQIEMRRDALEYVRQSVHEIWPSAEVHLFGSTATGLALPSSDIDVAVMSPVQSGTWQKPSTMSWLSALSRNLKRHGECRRIRQIPFAKVPLLKVVFNSGLACDISFDVANGIRGVPVIRQFMQRYEALRPLCLILKFLLGKKNLNELYTGGIGSFCLINMVVSHLQNLGASGPDYDLGILLLTFFVHFSTMHNYRTDVVCTRPGYCAPKHARGWVNVSHPDLLSCEDPLDSSSDIAKGSYRIEDVRKFFFKARTALLIHWHRKDVLSKLFEASHSSVELAQNDGQDAVDVTPEPDTGGKKESKKRKKKMNQQAASSCDDEDARSRKIRRLISKSAQQVSDSSRRRSSSVHRPAKLQKRKRKQKVERIYVDFSGNHVTKHRGARKVARKGRSRTDRESRWTEGD